MMTLHIIYRLSNIINFFIPLDFCAPGSLRHCTVMPLRLSVFFEQFQQLTIKLVSVPIGVFYIGTS